MREVFVVAPVRTPIGKFSGILSPLTAIDLGVVAVRETIKRSGIDPNVIDEVIIGHARQAGTGPNPARQIGYKAGIPYTTTAFTVNQACASSLKAVILAYQAIQLGDAELILVGGTESMSNTPYFLPKARTGYRLGGGPIVDGMYKDGFICPLCSQLMGRTAENLAEKYSISRQEQDEYAVESQHRCEEARKAGRFNDEITPINLKEFGGEDITVSTDEHPRDGVKLESMAKLPAVFKEQGTIHAGNSSGITDGASAMLIGSKEAFERHHLDPYAKITAYSWAGVDPSIMGIGPVPAIQKLQAKTEIKLDQIDLIELNEAFAAQVLACDRELHFDFARVNPNGGAIALGHPIGCTGSRIVVTLLHEMRKRNAHLGLATLCVSGGMGMTVLFKNSLKSKV